MKARHDEMRKHRREDRKLRKDEAKADKINCGTRTTPLYKGGVFVYHQSQI